VFVPSKSYLTTLKHYLTPSFPLKLRGLLGGKGRKGSLDMGLGIVGAGGSLIESKILRPDKKIKEYIEIYKKDARVRSAIDLTSYYAVGTGWKFSSDNPRLLKRANQLREELDMDSWLDRALKVMLITGDCYTEIRKDKNTGLGSLMILPSDQMETNRDKHGNIPPKNAYVQVLSDGSEIPFEYEQIDHMYRPFSSEPEGISVLAAAKYPIDSLWTLEKLMMTITEQFAAPLLIAKVGNAEMVPSPEIMNQIVQKLKQLSINKNRFWAVSGLVDFQQIEAARAALNINYMLDYYERQVYAALQVPPVLMGKPEGSNRTTAKEMRDSFERYVKSLQSILAQHIKIVLHRFGMGEVPDIIFFEITPEDEDAKTLRFQRKLGSDRSTGWATIDEIRALDPELHGTWKEAIAKQTVPDWEKMGIKPPVQTPEGVPGGTPRQKKEKPPGDDGDGDRTKEPPAPAKGTEPPEGKGA